MRIGLDLDDVLADLVGEMLQVYTELSGCQISREEVVAWDVLPNRVHEAVRHDGGYSRLKPLPGAAEFLKWITDRHDVCIVTYRGERSRRETMAWLKREFGGLYGDVYFAGGPKVALCRELAVELMIDDSYIQLPQIIAELGIPGILIDTPMNRQLPENELLFRAKGFDEARRLVIKLANDTA